MCIPSWLVRLILFDKIGCANSKEKGKTAHPPVGGDEVNRVLTSPEKKDEDKAQFHITRPSLGGGGSQLSSKSSQSNVSEGVREVKKIVVDNLQGNTFVNQYLILKNLGKGAFGKVKLCLNTEDNRLYAIKLVSKKRLRAIKLGNRSLSRNRTPRNSQGQGKPGGKDPIQEMMREIVVMKKLRHPNVVRLYEVVDDPDDDKMLMVLEYVDGGTLMGSSSDNPTEMKPVTEETARKHFRDVVKGLEYLHFNDVIHRDLKPDNLLMTGEGQVKISDFGSACHRPSGDDLLDDTCGTRAFFSPEMCAEEGNPYSGKKADIYALGVCLYMFVFGRVPFNGATVLDLFRAIRTQEVEFPDVDGKQVSPELKDLLSRLLDKDPEQRMTLPDVMWHDWVTNRNTLKTMRPSSGMSLRHINVSHEEESNAVTPSISHIFASLPDTRERKIKKGHFLVQEGQPTEGLFLIKEGICQVVSRNGGYDDLDREVSMDIDFAENAPEESSESSEDEFERDFPESAPTHGNQRPPTLRKCSTVSSSTPSPGQLGHDILTSSDSTSLSNSQKFGRIGSLGSRQVKRGLRRDTKMHSQMKELVQKSFQDRSVIVSQTDGDAGSVSRGPGAIIGILALDPTGKPPIAKETVLAVENVRALFVGHDALRAYFTGPDSHLQVRMLVSKLQQVALLRDTVEKFAAIHTDFVKMENVRKVSRKKNVDEES